MLASSVIGLVSIASSQTRAADQQYYRINAERTAAELTYLAADSTNATAYSGILDVPATTTHDGTPWPVTAVSTMAAYGCAQLTGVTLAEGITSIGTAAFAECGALQSATLPTTLTALHDMAFYCDSALQSIAVPTGVPRIGAAAFAFCRQMQSIQMPDSLMSIGRQAFYHCDSLKDVVIPLTTSAIGEYAFAYCSGLTQVTFLNKPIAITPDVFEGVDVSQCILLVPTNYIDEFRQADVWRDFRITDSHIEGIETVSPDGQDGFCMDIRQGELWLNVTGDAPAIIYDIAGRRIAIVASHSGESHIELQHGQYYIIRCGRYSNTLLLP